MWGFEAIAVRSGSEALEAVRLHSPDIILLDLAMPKMDGLQVAKRLRDLVPTNGKRPFVICMSGHADEQTRQRAQQAGIDLHLVKPVDPHHLEVLLRRFQSVVVPSVEPSL
jgi:CheY-like chemotaxis protein